MPLIQISVPEGSLDAARKAEMIRLVTDAAVTAEGIPAARAYTWVHINEVPDGGWGMAGNAITLAQMQAAAAAAAAKAAAE
ncbi:MAG: tautomerase enzyme [Alphaproteobacteria bacterium PA4]|nr:MAG: tautomerase enzyme [Alphaproteobacteria bacterium PA4]